MRTDRNRACVPCRLRYCAGVKLCGRCGRALTIDPAEALRRVPDPASLADPRELTNILLGFVLLGAVGLSGLWTYLMFAAQLPLRYALMLFFTLLLGSLWGLFVGAIILLPVYVGRRLYLWFRHPPIELQLTPDRRFAAADLAITGRIASLSAAPLVGPCSGESCAAFRVTGTFGGHAVDDADATAFVLVTSAGERILVDGPPATIALLPGAPEPIAIAEATPLAPFLAARGVPPGAGGTYLGEALLRVGDEVTVTGSISEEADPDAVGGYRDTPIRRVVRDSRHQPLVVRPAVGGDRATA